MGRISSYIIVLVLATTIMLCPRASDESCEVTRYPDLCAQVLARSRTSVDQLYALINTTLSHTNLPSTSSYFDMFTSHFISSEARQSLNAMSDCHELMRMSTKRLNQALKALSVKHRPGKLHKVKEDIQTWLSAAITYQNTCKDKVAAHVASNAYMARIDRRMDHLSRLSSNPLTLVNRLMVGGRGRRRLLSFPDRELLDLSGGKMKHDVVVAKDGTGDFDTVSEAIGAAPGNRRFVIYVTQGVYHERVKMDKDGVTLIGDGMYSTIIASSGSVGNGLTATLTDSATFLITGDGFMARDIGFFNSAGRKVAQAVALTVASDQSVFYRCSIAGYQDTLYALSLRQFYRECHIYGTIDFIFGNAAAVFQDCTIVLRRPLYGASNVIMANGRTEGGQNTGFVLQNCTITAGKELVPDKSSYNSYMGRPWKEYSRVVVMQSCIDDAISEEGWIMWQGAPDSTSSTLYFAEYENTGLGSGTSNRVSWPGYHVLGAAEAAQFTVDNFIGGESWLPMTGVDFISGLQ